MMNGINRKPQVPKEWAVTEEDKTFARNVQRDLPDKMFDIHAHVYSLEHIDPAPAILAAGPKELDAQAWEDRVGFQTGPDRLCGAMFIPMPSRNGDVDAANSYVLSRIEDREDCFATLLVGPQSSQEEVEACLETSNRIAGFKVYHCFSGEENSFHCDVGQFLPEWVWKTANERGLLIVLHMVKAEALADKGNQDYIREHCENYPNARLLLAHAARGFNASHTVNGISALRGLQNVWFDTSAICESKALTAILEAFGPRRLLWGSDLPVSSQRGRCVSLGDGFAWVTTDQVEWNERAFFDAPVQVGLESIRAVLDAAGQVGLNRQDLADIFCDNALRLLGVKDEPGNVTQALYKHAKTIIPGGTQLLSKRPEMFAPGQWPAYFREAQGCEVWDLDGRHYYDMATHGIGACLLGYRDPDVTKAVQRRLSLGSFSILNQPEEVELAERLCGLHPWAEQARFARTGGEMMSVAVRIARATTKRSIVAVCGYHGWHDWYLAANLGEDDSLNGLLLPGLQPSGVPVELRGTTVTFMQNDRDAFEQIIARYGDRLAAVVMEPCRYHDPAPGFLEAVREQTRKVGALLIFDEITIGWRLTFGGAHLRLGIEPDMAAFAKALGNGHPMAALIGTRAAMRGAEESFISSTYWTEGVGPVAALAVLDKMQAVNVPEHCERIGSRMQSAWRELGTKHGLPVAVDDGYPALAHFAFEHDQALALKTLYVQEMLKRGFLAGTALYVTLAHTDDVMDQYIAAVDEVFEQLANIMNENRISESLEGPEAHTGFKRLIS